MSYRFLELTTTYPGVESALLADGPIESLSYSELFQRFVDLKYGVSTFLNREMRLLGIDAELFVSSHEPLQKKWAAENGVRFNSETWFEEIVLAQISRFSPNVLYTPDLYRFSPKLRALIRQHLPPHCIHLGWRFAPTKDYSEFGDLDLVLTGGHQFKEKFAQAGVSSLVWPLAFEPSLLPRNLGCNAKIWPFTFSGSLGTPEGPFSQRYRFVRSLLPATPLSIWSDFPDPKAYGLGFSFYKALRGRIPGRLLRILNRYIPRLRRLDEDFANLLLRYSYPTRFHSPVFGRAYFDLMSSSLLVFNSHIDCADDIGGNMRLFEATGIGSCLVTDWKRNLPELFELDREIVTFRSAEECAEKVNYLLNHPHEAGSIADAGRKRTFECHTWRHRAKTLHEVISQLIIGRRI